MEFESLFRQFWWLIFPIFGMFMAIWGMISSERRAREAMQTIKSYVDQGKEPPQQLVDLAAGGEDYHHVNRHSSNSRGTWSWAFITFFAVSAGFTAGYFAIQTEKFAFAFLIVAVIMGVMALGALMMLLFSPKSPDQ